MNPPLSSQSSALHPSCFFRIDSKSFEVRIVWSKSKGEVQIVEKGKGFRRWIKASRGVVVWILKSIEACCKWRGKKPFMGDVNDRGRRFRIEMRQNDAGRYLLFSVLSEDDRRYFIIIPEGFDLLGWDLFRSKLKELARVGDGSKHGAEDYGTYGGRNETSLVRPGLSYVDAFKRKAKERSEGVWVEVGNEAYTSKLKDLRRCLVGRWNAENEAVPDLRVVEIWANTHWSFSGQVSVASLSESLLLFEFSKVGDAQKVLEEGSRCLNGVQLSLDWWAPTVGCSRRELQRDVSWVRIPRLPLQFWSMEFFKRVGDACGGFVDVDEETKKSSYRKGARILVKNNGKEVPGSLEVIAGLASFSIPLWWEDSVWFSAFQVANRLKIQREGEPKNRASFQQEEGGCEPRKMMRVKGMCYGEGDSDAAVGDGVSEWGLRIPEEKARIVGGEDPVSIQDAILGLPASTSGEFKTKRQRPSLVGESSEKKATPLDQGNRESTLKSQSPGMFPRSNAFGGVSGESFGFSSPSTSGMGNSVEYPVAWQSEVTCDEPLEAKMPLRVILKDGRSFTLPEGVTPKSRGKELQTPPLHIVAAGEGEKIKSPWVNKKFLGFCKKVGVSIEGFEEDILRILKEIENKRGVIRKSNDSKRGTVSASRKERELKKLVSTINYDGLAGREAEEGELEGKLHWFLMKLKIMSWNVRGLHDPDRRMVIKSMVRKYKPDLVCFQETKMKEMFDRIVRSLGIGRNLGWVSLDARGSAGGVLVMWDKKVLEGLEAKVGSFSISCIFKNYEEGFVWVFSGLYGPCNGKERRELWEELAAVKGLWGDPWCIAGDFNAMRFPVEESNGRQMSTTMKDFSGFIEEFELVDPPLGGGTFTWSGGEGGSLKARLDRFLFSGDWEEVLLPRPVSNH
ncbi:hypothetical protein CK203_024581 [Vitis vinifera]|uniref:DUF4283 domain-containing protein n=1 Tax=Vitis vinifera TaxID=29760 RepID=A0A438IU79_VITVI|nr:hypothetical protein CK203_024581 [Vitis vinifera]